MNAVGKTNPISGVYNPAGEANRGAMLTDVVSVL